MRLGVLGGTFDPVHLGHLWAAEAVREALELDEVVFVAARTPPHRPPPAAGPLDRWAMVALATSGHPRFVPCAVELDREGPSYTVETVALLHDQRPQAEVVLIVGSDAYAEMGGWRESDRLFALCEVAVVPRPGHAATDRSEGRRVRRIEAAGLPVSATEIRRRVREGRSIRHLVSEHVADYVAKRGLYR